MYNKPSVACYFQAPCGRTPSIPIFVFPQEMASPPTRLCEICIQRSSAQVGTHCVKCKNDYVHLTCLGITNNSNISGMIFWSCSKCSPTFAAELSALDRISAIEQKLECVDALIREVSLLRNEIATTKKPAFPFLKAAKTAFQRTQNDSTSSYQSSSVTKKPKADDFTIEITQRRLRPSKELKTGTNMNTSVISGVKGPPKRRHIYVVRLSQHICNKNGRILRKKRH